MIEDFCEFFKKIEADPSAMVEGLTVRDYLRARQHLASCDDCLERTDKVLAKSPKGSIGYNMN